MAAQQKPFCEKHQVMKTKTKWGRHRCDQCHKDTVKKYKEENAEYIKEKARIKAIQDREKNNERNRKINAINRELNGKRKIWSRFGIKQDEYDRMMEKCNGRCEICKQVETRTRLETVQRLCIDHCHASEEKGIMKVRGLLCFACNVMLGNAKENIETFKSAIAYLEKHKEQ